MQKKKPKTLGIDILVGLDGLSSCGASNKVRTFYILLKTNMSDTISLSVQIRGMSFCRFIPSFPVVFTFPPSSGLYLVSSSRCNLVKKFN